MSSADEVLSNETIKIGALEVDVDHAMISRETRGSWINVKYARASAASDLGPENMRKAAGQFADQLGATLGLSVHPDVLVVGAIDRSGGARISVLVRDEIADRLHAGDLLSVLIRHIGGRGGGRHDFAQGGGPKGAGLGDALALAPSAAAALFIDAPLGPER